MDVWVRMFRNERGKKKIEIEREKEDEENC
jgi:hypothetical protein